MGVLYRMSSVAAVHHKLLVNPTFKAEISLSSRWTVQFSFAGSSERYEHNCKRITPNDNQTAGLATLGI